jgi:acetyl esterase
MTSQGETKRERREDRLAEGVALFAQEIAKAYAAFPDFARLSYPEQRRAAEIVRAPWRQGGPVMARTEEVLVAGPAGPVRVRLYDPGGAEAKPALVYLHGGGWTFFNLETHDRLMREYAGRAGVIVLGVDYPLSPEAKFPRALEDILAVVRWAASDGAAFGVRADRLAIGGDSAGANLALATCLALRDEGQSELVRAMVLNYGAFHPHSSDEAEARNGGPDAMLNRTEMGVFWANYLADPSQATNPLAAPLDADLHDLPPAFLTVPDQDLLSEQSLALDGRLAQAGVRVRTEIYRGATHSFLEAVSVAPVADRALNDAAIWLTAELGGGLAEG